jgi:hypothetical protein
MEIKSLESLLDIVKSRVNDEITENGEILKRHPSQKDFLEKQNAKLIGKLELIALINKFLSR